MIAEKGPLVIYTGKCTGRSPNDKFFVQEPSSQDHVWWGKVNKPFDPEKFERLKARILDYFSRKELVRAGLLRRRRPGLSFPGADHHRYGLGKPVCL